MLQMLRIIRVDGIWINLNIEIWWAIKSKVLGERPVPGLHYPTGISQRTAWDLIHASVVPDRLHAAWCNILNVIMLFGTLMGANCRGNVCNVMERKCVVSSVCCEGESCGSVWTTEIWKSIKTCRRRVANSKSTTIAVCPGKLKLQQFFSKRLMYFNWNFKIIWFIFILPHSIRYDTLWILTASLKKPQAKIPCAFFISSEQ